MKKQLGSKKLQLSLAEFVWYGFNFMVGVTFVSYFAIAANITGDGMGLHVIWVWALDGIFATVCAMSFAKMSRAHEAGANGAAYVYARSTFGRTTGLLVGFIQYVYLPFSLSYQIMSVMHVTFAMEFQGLVSTKYSIYLGSYTDLWLDLISVLIYLGCVFVVVKGASWYKKIASSSALIKWISAGALIILAVYLCSNHNTGSANLNAWSHNSNLTISGFTKTFNSCFFAFIGFELFATAGKNVNNAQKNVSRGILIAMALAVAAYLSLTVLFFAAISPNTGFAENFNIQIWFVLEHNLPIGITWAGFAITIVSILAMRINSFMQKSLYGGTTLQPLAYEGFFPDKFGKLNDRQIPATAAKLNMIIVLGMCVVWLIIPDIIKGSIITSKEGFHPTPAVYLATTFTVFNVQSLSSFASVIAIFVYMMVILATMTLAVQKKIKMNVGEYAMYSLTLAFLGFIFVFHYYNIIDKAIDAPSTSSITGLGIELFTTLAVILFFVIWNKAYYQRKVQTRTVSQQRVKDKAFHQLSVKDEKYLME